MEDNKRKNDFEKLLDDVKGKHAKKLNAILLVQSEVDEDAFCNNMFKVMEYAAPKLQRSEIVAKEEDNIITINHHFKDEGFPELDAKLKEREDSK